MDSEKTTAVIHIRRGGDDKRGLRHFYCGWTISTLAGDSRREAFLTKDDLLLPHVCVKCKDVAAG